MSTGDPVGDRDLAYRASRGDPGAFSQLVQKHSDLVYRLATRVLGVDEAQDASQEVWMRVWRSIGDFRGQSAFSTWLYRVTMNTCLNVRKKKTRREERQVGEEPPQFPGPSGREHNPETAALDEERREEILSALQHVREEHRAALVLRHMEGLSHAEIAEILEVPVGTAKGWVSRGRAALLVVLSEKSRESSGEGEG